MIKIDIEGIKKSVSSYNYEVGPQQIIVYVMCGGGFIGRLAAEQPADFYIDGRVIKLPYPKKQIYQAVKVLSAIAEVKGLDTHNLPKMPVFHNSGIF